MRGKSGRLRRAATLFSSLLLFSDAATCQVVGGDPPPEARAPGVLSALGDEAKRYLKDAFGIVKAPLSWDTRDWEKAGGILLVTGVLLAEGRPIYDAVQRNRSAATNRLSSATTGFGSTNALAVSGALLAGGLIAKAPGIRDTGRDAIEASLLTGILTNVILKPLAGRERPYTSDGRTDFDPFSRNASVGGIPGT